MNLITYSIWIIGFINWQRIFLIMIIARDLFIIIIDFFLLMFKIGCFFLFMNVWVLWIFTARLPYEALLLMSWRFFFRFLRYRWNSWWPLVRLWSLILFLFAFSFMLWNWLINCRTFWLLWLILNLILFFVVLTCGWQNFRWILA